MTDARIASDTLISKIGLDGANAVGDLIRDHLAAHVREMHPSPQPSPVPDAEWTGARDSDGWPKYELGYHFIYFGSHGVITSYLHDGGTYWRLRYDVLNFSGEFEPRTPLRGATRFSPDGMTWYRYEQKQQPTSPASPAPERVWLYNDGLLLRLVSEDEHCPKVSYTLTATCEAKVRELEHNRDMFAAHLITALGVNRESLREPIGNAIVESVQDLKADRDRLTARVAELAGKLEQAKKRLSDTLKDICVAEMAKAGAL